MTLLAPIVAEAAESTKEAKVSATEAGSYLNKMPAAWSGGEKIAIVIYDRMTPLDVVGPHYFLGRMRGAQVQFVASDLSPVACENGLVIVPTATFDTCPKDLDVLLVGGGSAGTVAAMRDARTIDFLADRGSRAKWVTSVCTGSLLLGQAGLLRGYRATSHWLFRSLLKDFGAVEVDQRTVFDRNRATGAGVSAGIDLALALVQKLRPLDFAQAVQLLAEYAPEPPLHSGSPDTAPPAVVALTRGFVASFVDDARELARSARPAH
jgi:putative intracellular protease/amidase